MEEKELYPVPSESEYKAYVVTYHQGEFTCTCPSFIHKSFKFGMTHCKHIERVLHGDIERKDPADVNKILDTFNYGRSTGEDDEDVF